MEQARIGQLLIEAGLISSDHLEKALTEQASTGWRLGSTLVSLGFVDENLLATFLSMQTGVPCVSLLNVFPSPQVLRLIPKEVARRASVIPIKRVEDTLHVAMTDPTDPRLIDELARVSHLRIVPLIAPATSIARALQTYYPRRGRPRKMERASSPLLTTDVASELKRMEQAVDTLAQALARLRRRLGESQEGS